MSRFQKAIHPAVWALTYLEKSGAEEKYRRRNMLHGEEEEN